MRKALVVGLNDYPSAPLKGCVNDAVRFDSVISKNGDGSPNFHVMPILNTATKGELRHAIESLFEGDNDIVLFYFSGHGLLKNTGGYIVTTDATVYDEGISMDDILKIANRSKARDKVIILDCCHSGAFGSPSFSDNENKLAQLCDGLTILTASKSKESAIEINGSGVFTSLLLDALEGGAADLRGNITPGSVYSYIDEALGAWEQRPVFKTNVSRFTSLRTVSPKLPLTTLRKLKDYFENPAQEYPLNPTYEFTHQDALEEHVTIMKDLQKFTSVGLVVPVAEEHMYFAAINSKSCRLTALGYQYWRLATEGKI
ncbi:TPA: caspase family protein [Salmonella enterica subsp. enterica serovar Typhimurium var. 5-]|uniref:Caspase family protein n=1 Tax=Salmonella enterica subsp. enterica serovar Typhimurium var. 5- TaxID=1620419 RepID=A0A740PMC0_SALTM|nr:caspase family protein [Salmonella enterica subsp. enterica serovar Typhimurium var. 5-]